MMASTMFLPPSHPPTWHSIHSFDPPGPAYPVSGASGCLVVSVRFQYPPSPPFSESWKRRGSSLGSTFIIWWPVSKPPRSSFQQTHLHRHPSRPLEESPSPILLLETVDHPGIATAAFEKSRRRDTVICGQSLCHQHLSNIKFFLSKSRALKDSLHASTRRGAAQNDALGPVERSCGGCALWYFGRCCVAKLSTIRRPHLRSSLCLV
ncbi:hypothetical protein BJ875DRAFT_221655 [Amylocarpus encephaloides]|uniref:Uncharacterized protein n=1 Tax=Amylocarpus encephaloides TaxID=45428 RepID=A0A9P7YT50_9HELO|nr:hypothetical protein BJ875DRAFT_221655 [Amylocarpus encephaloides]